MKRIMVFWLVLLLPILVIAKDYSSPDINMKFSVNDDYIVLSRDNLNNNEYLDKLNTTKDYIEDIMIENDIYFIITKIDTPFEIIVVVPEKEVSFINLSMASSAELDAIKKTIIKETGDKVPTVYKNDYSFIVADYNDGEYYNMNYYTVINSRGYNIQLQKKDQITKDDENNLKEIVDTIKIKEVNNNSNSNKKTFNYTTIIYAVILGIMAGVMTYCISMDIKMKRQKKKLKK